MRRGTKGLALTDAGREYLLSCRKALGLLKVAEELVEDQRSSPKGIVKVACPVTMARDALAPLLKKFLERYPDLRVEIKPYCSHFDQEPRSDIDVFFKLRAPKDSAYRIRCYPNTERGLFASATYIAHFGQPATPDDLTRHTCIGTGVWKLRRGKSTKTAAIPFRVIASDPYVHLAFGLDDAGICMLPLWLAHRSKNESRLVAVLPQWKLEPLTLCALFTGHARLTPKVQALLDFLDEYIGTENDPRSDHGGPDDLFRPVSYRSEP